MSAPTLSIPENIRFDEAIQLTQSLLALIEQEELIGSEITDFVSALVKTANGARGFFVVYLTAQDPICDTMQPEIIAGLKASPTVAADLLVKNIAMSTAQVIFHRRNEDLENVASSTTVARRTTEIIKQLNSPTIAKLCQELLTAIQTGTGQYADFLNRWGYDDEQKDTIAAVVGKLIP